MPYRKKGPKGEPKISSGTGYGKNRSRVTAKGPKHPPALRRNRSDKGVDRGPRK